MSQLIYIAGERIILRPLLEQDFTRNYLNWLNDPEINQYSQRRPFPINWKGMTSYNDYLNTDSKSGFNLAIVVKRDGRHIGNISLVEIEHINRCCNLAILIGDKNYWNCGYATEAIYHLTRHAFFEINLNKIIAGSFNPAFIRCVEKLSWTKEGEFRKRIWSNHKFHNQIWMSILKDDFLKMETLEHQ